MKKLYFLVLFSLVFLVVLIPPGMCPCLLAQGNTLTAGGSPMREGSLSQLCRFMANELISPPAVVQTFLPAALLLALLANTCLLRPMFQLQTFAAGWRPNPLIPPPR